MRIAAVLVVALLGAGVAVAARSATSTGASTHAAPVRRAAYPAHLPPGAGRETAQRACLMCHSAMLITQQHKDSTGWEKTVGQMEKWGAPVPAAERPAMMAYLRAHFSSRPKR